MTEVVLRNPRRDLEVTGPIRVKALLRQLKIDPGTVLVIRGDELLTQEELINDEDTIEIRAVISGGDHPITKCRVCKAKAVVELPRHNSAFCKTCFLDFFGRQIAKAIKSEQMFSPTDKVLVAVSGGKDSLALWDVLHNLGYDTTGYHIVLWTGPEYAQESLRVTREFAVARGLKLIVEDLAAEHELSIPGLAKTTGRPTCGICGTVKRHLIGAAAAAGGFDVMAIGHNGDDEAAVLFGNVLRWESQYLARQSPVLGDETGFVKKVKPLFRLSEKETATYAFLKGIEYVVEECPLVAGNTQLRMKEALNMIEATSPGTKAAFYQGFLDKGKAHFVDAHEVPQLDPCTDCGMPTPSGTCAFCRLVALARTPA